MPTELVDSLKSLDNHIKEEQEQKRLKKELENTQTYAIQGTKFWLYDSEDDYLDKKLLTKFFNELYPVRELYINFHLGVTRVAIWFKKQLSRTRDDTFTFSTLDRSYLPEIETIKGKDKDVWKKVLNEFKKEDKMKAWDDKETQQNGIIRRTKCQEQKLENEKQREANQERRRTLNRERMQRYRKNILANKHEQENQQLKKENQQLRKENHQLKEELSRNQAQPEERPNDEQKEINKQTASQILGLQEQINKQNEIITKLQDHVNQVFGKEDSIEDEEDEVMRRM